LRTSNYFVVIALLLLVGCAGQPKVVLNGDAARAGQSQHWQLSGRFAANHDEQSWSGGLQWRQKGGNYLIRLSGPLGQGSVQLEGDEQAAQLQISDDEIYRNADAEQLLWQHTGWRIPFAGMRYWLRGEPAPFYQATQLQHDAQGRIASLHQAGWLIEIKRYISVEGVELPRKLFLQHAQFDVRLVVDHWELNS
jgi:outer membrane lipoprotein LolB